MKNLIYADHAATTPLNPKVLEQMLPFYTQNFGNPSSIYSIGRDAKEAIEKARIQTASALGANPEEIFFTASGTEADNWALKGVAFANEKKGKHIITSSVEHHAISHTLEYLKKFGFEVTYLPVDEFGLVRLEELKAALRPDTILISILFANNEIGTIQPITEIGKLAREKKILFHTDAVQAVGHLPIDVEKMNIDLLSLSAHKFNGPKGCGALYIRKGVKIDNFIHGGGQEKGRRAATENVAGIVGLGHAIELATANMEANSIKTRELRDMLIEGLLKIPYTRLNGHPKLRLDNNVNIAFQFVEGESILLLLDMNGICASSGSACTSGSLDPSHVLLAIGLPHEIAHGSLRLSLGPENTKEEVLTIIDTVTSTISRLREMSPLYEEVAKNNR
jgi:cysteine desulfurase